MTATMTLATFTDTFVRYLQEVAPVLPTSADWTVDVVSHSEGLVRLEMVLTCPSWGGISLAVLLEGDDEFVNPPTFFLEFLRAIAGQLGGGVVPKYLMHAATVRLAGSGCVVPAGKIDYVRDYGLDPQAIARDSFRWFADRTVEIAKA